MNLLEATQTATLYSGQRNDAGDVAAVRILTDGRHVNVSAVGVLTTPAQIRLALTIMKVLRRDPGNLILNLASDCGENRGLEFLLPAIALAKQQCSVLAKIDAAACGPALFAALSCHMVFAEPTAAIGHYGYWYQGVADADLAVLDVMNMAGQLALVALRPQVTPSTWRRLTRATVTGEQAEALGVVSGLKHGLLME